MTMTMTTTMTLDEIVSRRNAAAAAHESGHAVACRSLGVELVRVTAKPGAAGVVTRWRRADRLAGNIMRKSCLIALAGPAAEALAIGRVEDGAARADERNAMSYALRCMLDEQDVQNDAELNDDHRAQARALVGLLRARAAALCEKHWAQILAVAAALADGQILTGSEVDALMAGAPATRVLL
jgi:hypothetical protein